MRFKPQTSRDLAEFFSQMIAKWEQLTDAQKSSGDYINPDEPVVLTVPNPEFGGPGEDKNIDDEGNWRDLYFHVESHGGRGDIDEDGNECGHDGASISGMEIGDAWLFNGRRYKAARA